mmetsp:Transcript_38050/g.61831  ORF Transcript_38050/g.61831 Transcript_38050/m.61831 type:complete len:340 (+) Transcript_38050:103-1122(+)
MSFFLFTIVAVGSMTLQTGLQRSQEGVERPFSCRTCNNSFARKYTLTLHERRHTKEKPYKCPSCDFRCTTKHSFERHKAKHEKTPEQASFDCPICGKMFRQKYNAVVHARVHSRTKGVRKCAICGEGLNDTIFYRQHMRQHRSAQPYRCSICKAAFSNITGLRMHSTSHPRMLYQCQICDKSFLGEARYHNHVASHATSPFSCVTCRVSFKVKEKLQEHKASIAHQKAMKNRCEVCGRGFSVKHLLNQHMSSHGYRPFECRICERGFGRFHHYKVHMCLHTGENPFRCIICGAQYPQLQALLYHTNTAHQRDHFVHAEEDEALEQFNRKRIELEKPHQY